MSTPLTDAFHRSVDEGKERLDRSLPGLVATGAVGGLDVSVGVLALLVVEQQTQSMLLGALAFGLGFIALTLANSELFTENFLVPVAAVAAGKARWRSLLRLWAGTLAANLAGGWVAMGLIMVAFPRLRPTAVAVAERITAHGLGGSALASAVLAGLAITLMTWMERGTDSPPAKLVAAVGVAFVLAAAPLLHAVVVSLELFAALQAGAPFGYGHWVRTLGWALLGNMAGGLGLVTGLRLVQIGAEELTKERSRPDGEPREQQPDAA